MTANNHLDIALGLALIAWIGYRQLSWTPVAPQRMWRAPLIMAVIGAVTLSSDGALKHLTGSDLGVLALEVAVSLGLGAVMGAMAHFRPISAEPAAVDTAKNGDRGHRGDRGRAVIPTLETRTGWLGMALWLVLIGTRIGGEVVAQMTGSVLLTSTGVILLTVAVNRAVRILVITQRAGRVSARLSAPAVAVGSGAAA